MSTDGKMEAKVLAWFGAITGAMDRAMRVADSEALLRQEDVDTIVEVALGLVPDRCAVAAELGLDKFEKLRAMLVGWAARFKDGTVDRAEPARIFKHLVGGPLRIES